MGQNIPSHHYHHAPSGVLRRWEKKIPILSGPNRRKGNVIKPVNKAYEDGYNFHCKIVQGFQVIDMNIISIILKISQNQKAKFLTV